MEGSEALQETTDNGTVSPRSTPGLTTISVNELTGRLGKIQQARKQAMTEGTHFGEIPGVDKQTLLKPGAEILCTLFQFDPQPDVQVIDLGGDHREYRVTGSLYHIPTGNRVGGGVGSCSTKEKKYRYRYVDEVTSVDVPGDFWDTGESNAERDTSLLTSALNKAGVDVPDSAEVGTAKDDDGEWKVKYSHKGENPDIADVYNTCLKMAKKRWLVDAVLTATAASEMFTQDVEDMPNVNGQRKRRRSSGKAKGASTGTRKSGTATPSGAPTKGTRRDDSPTTRSNSDVSGDMSDIVDLVNSVVPNSHRSMAMQAAKAMDEGDRKSFAYAIQEAEGDEEVAKLVTQDHKTHC